MITEITILQNWVETETNILIQWVCSWSDSSFCVILDDTDIKRSIQKSSSLEILRFNLFSLVTKRLDNHTGINSNDLGGFAIAALRDKTNTIAEKYWSMLNDGTEGDEE